MAIDWAEVIRSVDWAIIEALAPPRVSKKTAIEKSFLECIEEISHASSVLEDLIEKELIAAGCLGIDMDHRPTVREFFGPLTPLRHRTLQSLSRIKYWSRMASEHLKELRDSAPDRKIL